MQNKEARLLFDRFKIVERLEETKSIKTYIASDMKCAKSVSDLNLNQLEGTGAPIPAGIAYRVNSNWDTSRRYK